MVAEKWTGVKIKMSELENTQPYCYPLECTVFQHEQRLLLIICGLWLIKEGLWLNDVSHTYLIATLNLDIFYVPFLRRNRGKNEVTRNTSVPPFKIHDDAVICAACGHFSPLSI